MPKRLVIAILLSLPLFAAADDCFDFTAWRKAIVNGDYEQSEAMVLAAVQACGCSNETARCLTLPGQAIQATPEFLRYTGRRMKAWVALLESACGALPEIVERERQVKIKCYRQQAEAFSLGLRGEEFGSLLYEIPTEIVNPIAARLGEGPERTPVSPAEQLRLRYGEEAILVAQQICKLTDKLRETQYLLEQVRRRGQASAQEKRQRELQYMKLIETLQEEISNLKHKFTLLTGESFNPLVFCGPQGDF